MRDAMGRDLWAATDEEQRAGVAHVDLSGPNGVADAVDEVGPIDAILLY